MTPDLAMLAPSAITPDLTGRLRRLADDLDRIVAGTAPSAIELARAPLLVDWQIVLGLPSGVSLVGFAAGHPVLGTKQIVTSPVWVLAPDLTWARTLSRFYRLGIPAGGAVPTGDGDGGGGRPIRGGSS